ADGKRRHVVDRLPCRGPGGKVGHAVVDRGDLADPDLNLGILRLEPPRQSAGDIGIETHRDLAREGGAGRHRLGDLRGSVESGCPAEPVVEGHCGIGRTDHHNHDKAANGGNRGVARQPQRGLGSTAAIHVHSGRLKIDTPLTNAVTNTTTTNNPSATAVAIDLRRRLRFCASVRTIPSGSRGSDIGYSCASYASEATIARTTTSTSSVANSAKR